ncbi:MAG: hypothetical protein LC808_08220 [Actinobacteria bacterium]|nr:hypothetical protein [Actinomycetota bacterium]
MSQADKGLTLQLETSLRNAASSEETFRASNASYTTDLNALRGEGLNLPPDITITIKSADAMTYCMEATHAELPGVTWHAAAGGTPTEGTC